LQNIVSFIGLFCKRDLYFDRSYQPKPAHTCLPTCMSVCLSFYVSVCLDVFSSRSRLESIRLICLMNTDAKIVTSVCLSVSLSAWMSSALAPALESNTRAGLVLMNRLKLCWCPKRLQSWFVNSTPVDLFQVYLRVVVCVCWCACE